MNTTISYSDRKGPWIQTFSGGRFYFYDPRPEDILIEDIAAALSKQCRFAGHLTKFYSVAEHSLAVSVLCKPQNQLAGLLHDASEAYLVDMPSPIKAELKSYRDVELIIMTAIADKFGFEWPMSPDVHEADKVMLTTEAKYLLLNCEWINEPKYKYEGPMKGLKPLAMNPQAAEYAFLSTFKELTRLETVY